MHPVQQPQQHAVLVPEPALSSATPAAEAALLEEFKQALLALRASGTAVQSQQQNAALASAVASVASAPPDSLAAAELRSQYEKALEAQTAAALDVARLRAMQMASGSQHPSASREMTPLDDAINSFEDRHEADFGGFGGGPASGLPGLPPQHNQTTRLRGIHRNPGRVDDFTRRFVETGFQPAEARDRFQTALRSGTQVPPSPYDSGDGSANAYSSGVLGRMQRLGFAPQATDQTDMTPEMVMHSLLAAATKKAATTASAKIKDYADPQSFYKAVFDNKLNTLLPGEDPDHFEAFQFILKCTQYIELHEGWGTAYEYYKNITAGWADGDIDVVRLMQRRAAQRGAMQAAVHQESLLQAQISALKTQVATLTKSNKGGDASGRNKGRDERGKGDKQDTPFSGSAKTWCTACNKEFPKTAGHKPGECSMAAKAKYLASKVTRP
jgi:hypothetical protein